MSETDRAAESVRDTLHQLWSVGRQTSIERVETIESSLAAMLLGEPDVDRDEAATSAHKLAGTLGMFGLPGGSAVAREIELLLECPQLGHADLVALSELAVELRRSVESSPVEPMPPQHTGGTRLLLIGPDRSYMEALRMGAGQQGLVAQWSRSWRVLPDCEGAVVVFDVTTRAPVTADVDGLRRRGASLVVGFGANGSVDRRIALASCGLDLVLGADLDAEVALEAIIDELGRRRRTAHVTLVAASDRDVAEFRGALSGWTVDRRAPDELFGPLDQVPDAVVVDARSIDAGPAELCRALQADARLWSSLVVVVDEGQRAAELLAAGADQVTTPERGWGAVADHLRSVVRRQGRRAAVSDARVDDSPDAAIAALAGRLASLRREGDALTVAFLSPSDLGSVSERDGPAAGDALLERLGRSLSRALPGSDVVGRWGTGYVVALAADPLTARDRLASVLAEMERAGLTVAAGTAVLGDDGTDAEVLLRRAADRAQPRSAPASRTATDRIILLVEDDPLVAAVVEDLLTTRGHRVTVLTDGPTAADLLGRPGAADVYALVLLDVSLPGLDGFSVLRRMRRAGTTPAVPVILLTARATEDEIVTGLELGAVDHVAKPFSPLVLMRRIELVLSR